MIVFFDFDNTITTKDVLDDMLERFSVDDKWRELEEKWKNEEIGSEECLRGQVAGLRISKSDLDKYLLTIKIDPYFKTILDFLKDRNIKSFILSDNFDYMINRILKNNNLEGISVFSNSVSIKDDNLSPSFPLSNRECGECAHCKKTTLSGKVKEGDASVYVGDGRSDICASGQTDIVFAKDYLGEYYRQRKLPHVPIKGLKDVYDYFEEKM